MQLVLPVHQSRAHLFFQNNGSHTMWVEFGSARATATITSGAISSIAVTNAGFNFTYPPIVRFAGGGNAGNSRYLGLNQPGGEGPNSSLIAATPATAHATLTSSAVSLNKVNTIVVDNGGSGFVIAPFVFLYNDQLDPYGCAVPSSGVGIQVLPTAVSSTMAPLVRPTRCPCLGPPRTLSPVSGWFDYDHESHHASVGSHGRRLDKSLSA